MRDRLTRITTVLWQPLVLGALVCVAAAVMIAAGREFETIATAALIQLVLVVGLYTFVGNSGVLSFGHVSFMALGAYLSGAFAVPQVQKETLYESMPGILQGTSLGLVPGMLVVALVVGAIAYLLAVPLMRLNGIAAGIATFALLAITQILLLNWTAVFGPNGSFTGVPVDLTVGVALGVVLVVLGVAATFQASRTGLRLRAAREDEVAARAAGIGVARERRIAFALAAAIMAVGGAMYAHFIGSLNPGAFYIQLTFLTIAMLVVGGTHSLAGAVAGWALISVVSQVFTRLEAGKSILFVTVDVPLGLQQALLAVILLVVLALRPDGVTRGRELPLPVWLRRRRSGASAGERGAA